MVCLYINNISFFTKPQITPERFIPIVVFTRFDRLGGARRLALMRLFTRSIRGEWYVGSSAGVERKQRERRMVAG